MSVLALTRSLALKNAAKTVVITAGTPLSKLNTKPVIGLPQADDHHDDSHSHMLLPNSGVAKSANKLSKLLIGGKLNVANSFTKSTSVRYAHTDETFPDMSDYRNKYTIDPNASARDNYEDRHTYSYVSTVGTCLLTVYAGKAVVHHFIDFIKPAKDVLAMAKVEVKLSDIPEGKNLIVKWRNKPLFIRHRTQEDITRERAVDVASLRDPQSDESRVQKPEWLVLLGICTHLGCVPIAGAGDFNGYFCPCHGSHYDGSGRIRKGPAPLNLAIPTHEFVGEEMLIVG
jgi:ubiquinol-cytochrome c reductase iron-sulfur subunit